MKKRIDFKSKSTLSIMQMTKLELEDIGHQVKSLSEAQAILKNKNPYLVIKCTADLFMEAAM